MADLELNSIGNGDGNNYLLRDNTKIPLSGSSQISGDLIPSTTDTVNLGSLNNVYNITYSRVLSSGSDTSKYMGIYSGSDIWGGGGALILYAKNCTLDNMSGGEFTLCAVDGLGWKRLIGSPNGTLIWEGNVIRPATDDGCDLGSSGYAFKNIYTYSLISASQFAITRNVNNDELNLYGGVNYSGGAVFQLKGKDVSSYQGCFIIHANNGSVEKMLIGDPSGTLTWDGQPIQYTSDQRLKQQITQIDNALLDAWEDVNPVQFKYNEAVKEKSDNARLHTGYVVQQIDEACKKHNVDISAYGLYCHEEYAEETEEVEVEQKDGTKTKERKVIREASEHYSLRYTETLVVECAYLRRENNKLKQQMLQYAECLSKLEERLKALEQSSK